MLGIHGNGLTHELWLPEKGSLIEVIPIVSALHGCHAYVSQLFPNEMFLRDYACVAEVLGHHYTAIVSLPSGPSREHIPHPAIG